MLVVWALAASSGSLLALTSAGLAATLEIRGPEGVPVTIDGDPVGSLPLASPLSLPAGEHTVRCERPGYIPYTDRLTLVEDDRYVLQIRLTPYRRQSAIMSNLLLAGLGQCYLGRSTEGCLFMVAEIGGLLAALAGELSFQNHRDDYLNLVARYEAALTEVEIQRYRMALAESSQQMKDDQAMRDTGLLVAAGAVAVSILDAWLRFPGVEAGPEPVPPRYAAGGSPLHLQRARAGAASDAGFHVAWRLRF
jgi:hypothetical protein